MKMAQIKDTEYKYKLLTAGNFITKISTGIG